MHPEEIAGCLYLPSGRQYQAEWWMTKKQVIDSHGTVYHGVPVKRTYRIHQKRDLID